MIVSDLPPQVHVYDPTTGSEAAFELPLAPTSVAVDPAGDYAAIGHDGWGSILQLSSPSFVDVHPVSTPVGRIALSDLGWAYASPLPGKRWLHSLDLATDAELSHADHEAATGTIIAVRRTGVYGSGTIGTLYVFDDVTLTQRDAIALPTFPTSAGPYSAAGLYAFIAPGGGEAYVVARSEHPTPTYNADYDPDFAVITLTLPPP